MDSWTRQDQKLTRSKRRLVLNEEQSNNHTSVVNSTSTALHPFYTGSVRYTFAPGDFRLSHAETPDFRVFPTGTSYEGITDSRVKLTAVNLTPVSIGDSPCHRERDRGNAGGHFSMGGGRGESGSHRSVSGATPGYTSQLDTASGATWHAPRATRHRHDGFRVASTAVHRLTAPRPLWR